MSDADRYFNVDEMACLLENSDDEGKDGEDDSDADSEDNVEEPRKDSETEQEDDTDENDNSSWSKLEDKITKWYHKPVFVSSRTKPHNLPRHLPGPRREARLANSPAECWACFFTDDILKVLVTCTNQCINFVKNNYSRSRGATCTDTIEMKAFIGLLNFAGAYTANRRSLKELWGTEEDGKVWYDHEHQKIQVSFALHAV